MREVVLITGASSGIGYATANAFARKRLKVAGTARRADRLAELTESISTTDGFFLPLTADIRDSDAMQRAVDETLARYSRLDVLIANAGVGQRGAVVDANWDDLDTLLRTNIDGVLHSIRAAVPAMRKTGSGGHIVIVSSVMFNMVAPYTATYAASKAFVSSLARSLRLELAPDNILVTDMLVGRTVTEFNDKRLGQAGRGSGNVGVGGRIPEMSAEQVADAIVRVVLDRPRDRVALRWIDRLLVAANMIAPGLVGRLSARQYR